MRGLGGFALRGGCEFAHQGIDLAGGNRHDDPLDGADFFVRDVLFPGHAKVVLDSWLTFPGQGRSQSDHCRGAGIEMFLVADDIVEIAVGFMLFGRQHRLIELSCAFWLSGFPGASLVSLVPVSEFPSCLCNKLFVNFQQY